MRIVQFQTISDTKTSHLGIQVGDENGDIVEIKDFRSTLELLEDENFDAVLRYKYVYFECVLHIL